MINTLLIDWREMLMSKSPVIKQKGKSQKGCFKNTKHDKFSEKRTFLTLWCAYQGVRNVRFSKNLACFVFLKHPFWDLCVCLITDEVSFLTNIPFPYTHHVDAPCSGLQCFEWIFNQYIWFLQGHLNSNWVVVLT